MSDTAKMTQADLIQLARECGAEDCFGNDLDPAWANHYTMSESALSLFRDRVRAQAMEEAAKICDRQLSNTNRVDDFAHSIVRHQCATAIRQSGNSGGER